jgi:hypothetical protein
MRDAYCRLFEICLEFNEHPSGKKFHALRCRIPSSQSLSLLFNKCPPVSPVVQWTRGSCWTIVRISIPLVLTFLLYVRRLVSRLPVPPTGRTGGAPAGATPGDPGEGPEAAPGRVQ